MRLVKHLNEESPERMIEFIKNKCAPFLREIKGGNILWRGTKKSFTDMGTYTPRKDRRPMDTDDELHEHMDKLFKKYHGWKARSEGVFTNPSRDEAVRYGKPCMFFPIGNFKYLWNTIVEDLKVTLGLDYEINYMMDIDPEHEEWDQDYGDVSADSGFGRESAKENRGKLDRMIKGYDNHSLKQASKEGNEIMFKCKQYFLIEEKYSLGKSSKLFRGLLK